MSQSLLLFADGHAAKDCGSAVDVHSDNSDRLFLGRHFADKRRELVTALLTNGCEIDPENLDAILCENDAEVSAALDDLCRRLMAFQRDSQDSGR